MDIANGTRLKNRYEILSLIGKGGFGNIYKAVDHLLNRFVAIKCSEYSLDHEANILRALENVPHICSIYDYFVVDDVHYLVMKLIEERNMSEFRIESGGTIPSKILARMLPSAFIILDQMHDRGIIHRDISPGNFIITEDDTLYLVDFGAATSLNESGLKNKHTFRHKGLDSPEYNDMKSQGPWTDIYSICSTIVYLLTGEGVPKAGDRQMFDPVPSLLVGKSLSYRMQNALIKGLSLNVKFRYDSVREFATDFLGIDEGSDFKEDYSVHYHAKTFIGGKDVNQDNFMVDKLFAYAGEDCEIKGYIPCKTGEYHIVALADGVSSVFHSELASKAAIQAVSHFIDNNSNSDRPPENLLEDLLDQLNEKILILSEKIGRTATTISMFLWKDNQYCMANIGDSPIYRLNGRKMICLSKEQTVAREKIENGGEIKPSDFHSLYNYLGKKNNAGSQMACIKTGRIEKGDIFLLCSDGVARSIEDSVKAKYIRKDGDKAVKKIYDKCVKNPKSDNCTAVILKF